MHGQSLIRWLNRRAAGMRSLSLLRSEPVLTCRPESFIGVERCEFKLRTGVLQWNDMLPLAGPPMGKGGGRGARWQ